MSVRQLLLFLSLSTLLPLSAQFNFHGRLKGVDGKPMAGVGISEDAEKIITYTDSQGEFDLKFKYAGKYSIFGYKGKKWIFGKNIEFVTSEYLEANITEKEGGDVIPIVVIYSEGGPPFMESIRIRGLGDLNPTTGSGIESIIKTLPGVSSGNELSSQYSVRGGNFDENLVYVNDIEIYRPQLIHSGQQEGLSFINPDLVESIRFSAGGFEAQYGDKMSSVLDVEYVRPDSFGVRVNLGLMTNSLSVESRNGNLRSIVGIRYFSNALLARSLEMRGAYNMHFADAQALLAWRIKPRWELSFLGNLAYNRYQMKPQDRQTDFGTAEQAFRLDVGFEGSENMSYTYAMGALTLKYNHNFRQEYKWIFAATGTDESELFDVQGAYELKLLDKSSGSNFGKPLRTLGFGYFIDHGRNVFQSSVLNFSHIGTLKNHKETRMLKYGLRLNLENVYDKYKEWRYNDSAGYNVPPFGFATDSIIFDDQVSARNELQSIRVQAFVQNRWSFGNMKNMQLGVGIRGQYWEINREIFATPRLNFNWEPYRRRNLRIPDSLRRHNINLKMAIGGYYQPAFYRELRDFDGSLNKNLKAQRAYHFVMGRDKYFYMWGRKFKLSSEAYYKQMQRLNPYLYDNIRIRYYAENSSEGYAWGVDNRINGEFIRDLQSWFTLSVLQSREKITYTDDNGQQVTSDWLRRPTDRRVNFAAIFQDQLRSNPSYRFNLNMLIGTGIPYFLDGKARYAAKPNVIPAYRRVDVGFSKVIKGRGMKTRAPQFLRGVSEAWVSLEIFNLLDISNVISYQWVKDIYNNTYGVPEYLTRRRLNIRLHLEF